MGGSTNTVLHTWRWRTRRRGLPAGAIERGRGARAEYLQGVSVVELPPRGCGCRGGRVGYSPGAVEAAGILHTDAITVTGKTLLENVQGADSRDKACIRPLENPYSERGGLAILFGGLAPTER